MKLILKRHLSLILFSSHFVAEILNASIKLKDFFRVRTISKRRGSIFDAINGTSGAAGFSILRQKGPFAQIQIYLIYRLRTYRVDHSFSKSVFFNLRDINPPQPFKPHTEIDLFKNIFLRFFNQVKEISFKLFSVHNV